MTSDHDPLDFPVATSEQRAANRLLLAAAICIVGFVVAFTVWLTKVL